MFPKTVQAELENQATDPPFYPRLMLSKLKTVRTVCGLYHRLRSE